MQGHPKIGASWEGFIIHQILTLTGLHEAYHWRTQAGAELDLLLPVEGQRIGFEIKYTDSPTITKSMRIAIQDLGLNTLYIVHAGSESYTLDHKIVAIAACDLPVWLKKWDRQ